MFGHGGELMFLHAADTNFIPLPMDTLLVLHEGNGGKRFAGGGGHKYFHDTERAIIFHKTQRGSNIFSQKMKYI